MSAKPQNKTFGKSTRAVPASTEKAKKWYPAEADAEKKLVSRKRHVFSLRAILMPSLLREECMRKGQWVAH